MATTAQFASASFASSPSLWWCSVLLGVFVCVRCLCGGGVRFGALCTYTSSSYMMWQCSCLYFKKKSQRASKSHPDRWQNGGAEIKRLQIPSAKSRSSSSSWRRRRRFVCYFWAFYFYSGDQTHYCLYVPSLNDSIYRVATFTVECRKDVTSNGVILNCSERT